MEYAIPTGLTIFEDSLTMKYAVSLNLRKSITVLPEALKHHPILGRIGIMEHAIPTGLTVFEELATM
jgi:hypothetical protein